MKISVKAMTMAFGLVWGLYAVGGTGLLNLIWPPYGEHLLQTISSVYPGYHATRTVGDVLVAASYGMLDGGAAGFLMAITYNFFVAADVPSK
jgi:hypothetical protein